MRKFTRVVFLLDGLLVSGASLLVLAWGILSHPALGLHHSLRSMEEALRISLGDPAFRLGLEAGAAGFILLHLFWVDWALRSRRRGNVIVVPREDGSLIIALSAVEDSLERAVKQQAGVRDVRVRVRVPREPESTADVVVVASILDAEGIHAVEERMRQAVKRRFQEILPSKALRVSVRLRRFVAGEPHRRRGDEVERVYRGPEYPVEGF